MKLSNLILSAMVLVGSMASANTTVVQKSNSDCPHSKKNDSWTQSASLDSVNTVFGSTSNPGKKSVPQSAATATK